MKELNNLKMKYPNCIKEVRGIGLLIGIELISTLQMTNIIEEFKKNKIFTVSAGMNTLRIIPALIIEKKEIKFFIKIFSKILFLKSKLLQFHLISSS